MEVIRQAHEINLLGEDRSLFLSNLNTHTIDFQQLPHTKLNITSVRLTHPENLIRRAIYDWTSLEAEQGRSYTVDRERVKNSMILIHDAVRLFATALKANLSFKDMDLPSGDCNIHRKWEHGRHIINTMKLLTRNSSLVKESQGFTTGRMDLDRFGDRSYFQLDVTILFSQFFHKLISWNPEDGFTETFEKEQIREKIGGSIQNKTFIVSTRLGAPFLMERTPEDNETLEGNARFEGYSIDLIQSLSEKLKFKYVIKLVPDKRYGQYNKKTKKWDGIIRQLIDGKADMGICDLTMTYERRQAVDFTVPFMSLGISILFSKPVKPTPNLFSFLLPYSLDVWMYVGVICLFTTALLFAVVRLSDEEWESDQVIETDTVEIKVLRNTWNLGNRFWLTMGSLMGQGCDLLPRGVPMRLITGVWWFFALMLLNSYTANLAAFLTSSRIEEAINDVEDLAEQTKIKYGVLQGGSTMSFFKDSNDSLYRKMWAAMENAQPSVFATSNEEGKERVQKGRRMYAFLMESTSLEYITERHCDLMEVGSRFGDKFYGIALPLNSRYRTIISQELLRMSERGELYELKMKWWKRRHGDPCITEIRTDENELGIEEVGGVFIVLGVGLFVAFVIGIFEFLWHVHKVALNEKIPLKEAFKSQAMFALKFWIKYKPVRTRMNENDISRRSSKATLKKWEIKNDKIDKTD
ncbi:unnamed protein product [Hermetia illucens]|uniref:Uncharacterized protein n=2 Tax=Hermetia illucens TaxID=343691 RepID=A0A7R8YU97_HERIL|nr:unnamed protein product [Hermetia illucens]